MKIIEGGVTKAKGFEAASTAAKIKYEGRTDMALVYSSRPCVAAGTFTTNVVKAARGQVGQTGRGFRQTGTRSRSQLRNRKCLHRRRRDVLL